MPDWLALILGTLLCWLAVAVVVGPCLGRLLRDRQPPPPRRWPEEDR